MDCICSSDEREKFEKRMGATGKLRSITYIFEKRCIGNGVQMKGGLLNTERFGGYVDREIAWPKDIQYTVVIS
jgi:hypothetical protein